LGAAQAQPAAQEVDVRQLWQLIDYVAVDYGGAVSQGRVVSEGEYAEMREFTQNAEEQSHALPLSSSQQAIAAAVADLESALREAVIVRARPFLGICVGMQLMADRGREFETVEGLGWISGEVVAIEPGDPALKIPHMGWNEIEPSASHPLLAGFEAGAHAYFVHSYHFRLADPADIVAVADYGGPLTAMIGRDNLAGTQFHPEKSQAAGLRLIGNFLRWRP